MKTQLFATQAQVTTPRRSQSSLKDKAQSEVSESDFTQFDTPQEALALPIMDPAFQVTLEASRQAIVMGKRWGQNSMFELKFERKVGDVTMEQTTTLAYDPVDKRVEFSGTGQFNGVEQTHEGSVSSDGFIWNSTFGENEVHLIQGDDQLKGQIGEVDLSLDHRMDVSIMSQKQNVTGLGQLDGSNYETSGEIKLNRDFNGQFNSRASYGGEEFQSHYDVSDSGKSFSGSGTILNTSFEGSLHIKKMKAKKK